jgi:hypothetical protein
VKGHNWPRRLANLRHGFRIRSRQVLTRGASFIAQALLFFPFSASDTRNPMVDVEFMRVVLETTELQNGPWR